MYTKEEMRILQIMTVEEILNKDVCKVVAKIFDKEK